MTTLDLILIKASPSCSIKKEKEEKGKKGKKIKKIHRERKKRSG